MIGILTFHRSHNYGSVLQSYALQYWLYERGYNNEIIDLYTNESKKIYCTNHYSHSINGLLKLPFQAMLYKKMKKRWIPFFSFQKNFLKLSQEEYADLNDLKDKNLKYTTYITGSDQIWNTACFDFNWAYFLAFVTYKCKRIAYAPSIGPVGKKEQSAESFCFIQSLLKKYDFISVREKGTADFLEEITNNRPPITIDPTLLLNKNVWEKQLLKNKIIINNIPKHYIFFYTLKHDDSEYKIVKQIAAQMNLPVIITQIQLKKILYRFTWKIDAGPWDFIYLIQHADLVLTSSFHGTAFSIIFEKLFYSINGAQDNRISSLLKSLNISERAISLNNFDNAISKYDDIDYVDVKKRLSDEIQQSEEFLYTALKGEENGDLSS